MVCSYAFVWCVFIFVWEWNAGWPILCLLSILKGAYWIVGSQLMFHVITSCMLFPLFKLPFQLPLSIVAANFEPGAVLGSFEKMMQISSTFPSLLFPILFYPSTAINPLSWNGIRFFWKFEILFYIWRFLLNHLFIAFSGWRKENHKGLVCLHELEARKTYSVVLSMIK